MQKIFKNIHEHAELGFIEIRTSVIVIGIEDHVGTLEPGNYADFVVLSQNFLKIDFMKIKDIKIAATVMNGRITYLASTKGFYHH